MLIFKHSNPFRSLSPCPRDYIRDNYSNCISMAMTSVRRVGASGIQKLRRHSCHGNHARSVAHSPYPSPVSLDQTCIYSVTFLRTCCGPHTVHDGGHPKGKQSDKGFCPYWTATSVMEEDKAERGNKEVPG